MENLSELFALGIDTLRVIFSLYELLTHITSFVMIEWHSCFLFALSWLQRHFFCKVINSLGQFPLRLVRWRTSVSCLHFKIHIEYHFFLWTADSYPRSSWLYHDVLAYWILFVLFIAEYLSLNNNTLTGTIPSEIGSMKNLSELFALGIDTLRVTFLTVSQLMLDSFFSFDICYLAYISIALPLCYLHCSIPLFVFQRPQWQHSNRDWFDGESQWVVCIF